MNPEQEAAVLVTNMSVMVFTGAGRKFASLEQRTNSRRHTRYENTHHDRSYLSSRHPLLAGARHSNSALRSARGRQTRHDRRQTGSNSRSGTAREGHDG